MEKLILKLSVGVLLGFLFAPSVSHAGFFGYQIQPIQRPQIELSCEAIAHLNCKKNHEECLESGEASDKCEYEALVCNMLGENQCAVQELMDTMH